MRHRVRLTCCCCDGNAGRWYQHHNRDNGFGICVACVEWIRGKWKQTDAEFASSYGAEGVNWGADG